MPNFGEGPEVPSPMDSPTHVKPVEPTHEVPPEEAKEFERKLIEEWDSPQAMSSEEAVTGVMAQEPSLEDPQRREAMEEELKESWYPGKPDEDEPTLKNTPE